MISDLHEILFDVNKYYNKKKCFWKSTTNWKFNDLKMHKIF